MKAIVTSKGQVTIPKMIREKANITTGTQLDFQLGEDGIVSIIPRTRNLSEMKGFVKSKRKKPVSLKEMKKAIQSASLRSLD